MDEVTVTDKRRKLGREGQFDLLFIFLFLKLKMKYTLTT
jgi:hypothetical protein